MIGTYDILFADKIIVVADIIRKELPFGYDVRVLARDIILAINKLEAEHNNKGK